MRRILFGVGGIVFLLGLIASIAMVLCFCLFDMMDAADMTWKVIWAEVVGLIGCGIGAGVSEEKKEGLPVVGYMASFDYLNGFRKTLYWSKEKMLNHADQYSKAFSRKAYEKIQAGQINDRDMWKYSSFWYKNFDEMAKKTLLCQLISKWGIMSIEMQEGIEMDNSTVNMDTSGVFTAENPPMDLQEQPQAVAEPEPARDIQPAVDPPVAATEARADEVLPWDEPEQLDLSAL